MKKPNNIYLVPGPVIVPAEVSAIYQRQLGSADLEPEFFATYAATEKLWQQILDTRNSLVMMTGEGMLGLWAGLKSCLKNGDKVLALTNGMFGVGIGAMAQAIGAQVEFISFGYNEAITDLARIESAIKAFRPKMITMVHCETPSGILNSIEPIALLKRKYQVPLLYVDAVSSIGGVEVKVDDWHIDICLGGGQKSPSVFPDMTFLTVSPAAWAIIEDVGYAGYDALKPFRYAVKNREFPYTPHWHGVAALKLSAELLLAEGVENVYARHRDVAKFCRESVCALGLQLFPRDISSFSPTVTAIKVPDWISWPTLNHALCEQGVFVGGNYGILAGKVFRIGHMGTQANLELVRNGMNVLGQVLLQIHKAT